MEQNWTNPFIGVSKKPYCLIAASENTETVTLKNGTTVNAEEIKKELGYPQLYAWNYQGAAACRWIELLKENPNHPCRLVIDSGAYSAWSKGVKFDMDEYINWLQSTDAINVAFWIAEADVIPGSFGVDPTPEEIEAAPQKSWENYLYMIERVTWPKKIVPIFHMGEDFKYLRQMLEYKLPDGDHIPYIGISPRNDVQVNAKIEWYKEVWRIINESSNPNVLTHNFGCTTLSIIEQFPSMSSDSTSWLKNAIFGNIQLIVNGKIKQVVVSPRKTMSPDYILNQSPDLIEAVRKEVERVGHGITLDDILEDDKGGVRASFNLYVLDEWRQSFTYKGNNSFKKALW